MKTSIALLSAVTVFFTSASYGQKTYTLTFNPDAGNQYAVTTSAKSKVAQNVMGQDMDINMDYNINMTYAVSAEGPNKKLSITYDQLKMNMDIMGQKITMDSNSSDSADVASKGFKALKGQTVSITLSPEGKAVKVEGADAILDKIADDPAKRETIKGILGEDAIKTMLQQSFGFYPATPVKEGDSWTSTVTLKSPYEINANNTYTLQKVEGKKALINVVSKLSTQTGSKMSYNGIEMTLDLSGDIAGTIETDMDSGMPISSSTTQKLKGNIEVQGQKVPMAMSSDIIMTVAPK